MARFPPGFIADLKAQADIVQVIQDVVPLRQVGGTFKGLCPFHREKTPSFNVNREKGFFHCFGCSTGGDVLKFVELYEKLSFPEAVQALAQRFGLTVPESDDPQRDRAEDAGNGRLCVTFTSSPTRTSARNCARRPAPPPCATSSSGTSARRRSSGSASGTRRTAAAWPATWRTGVSRSSWCSRVDSWRSATAGGRYDRFRQRLMIPIAGEIGCRSSRSAGGRSLPINSPSTSTRRRRRCMRRAGLSTACT